MSLAQAPAAISSENMELIGYHDLEDRPAFKTAIQEVDGRFYIYLSQFWVSGWSILDVTDPENPELLRFIEGPDNTWTLQVQVADGLLITSLEKIPPAGAETRRSSSGRRRLHLGRGERPRGA